MIEVKDEILKDIEAVRQIPIVPTMLEVVCQTTGMGFAAVARVTDNKWVACSVRDEVDFGLREGGELKIETTLCNEIRDSRQPIVIDHVAEDPDFKHHHTPKIYGLQSYISVPIILKDGTFFGTLCAIDSKPAKVKNSRVIGTFNMFAELLAFHLQSLDLLERSYSANLALEQKNKILTTVNHDLDTFVFTASHDLKSPVNNIRGLIDALSGTVTQDSLDKKKIHQIIGMMKSSVDRLGLTLEDLTTVVEADRDSAAEKAEAINIFELVEDLKQDLASLIYESDARIAVNCEEKLVLNFSKKNCRSILYNLLSNAIKYRSPERTPEIRIRLLQTDGKMQLSVQDNGLGIPADKQDKLFMLFERFHDHVEGSGIGLYIVKRMLDNAEAQIQVISTPNKGTTFTISF